MHLLQIMAEILMFQQLVMNLDHQKEEVDVEILVKIRRIIIKKVKK